MKNRIRNRTAATEPAPKFIEVNIKVRLTKDRWDEFNRLSRNLGLQHGQLASAIISGDFESNKGNPFYEIGYHLTRFAADLYPEYGNVLAPLNDAFSDAVDAEFALQQTRTKLGAIYHHNPSVTP